jgi:hypothetical protein
LDNSRTLWLMEISKQTFEDQAPCDLDDDGGLFVILEDESESRFDILAKAASFSAGQALLNLFTSFLGPKTEAA